MLSGKKSSSLKFTKKYQSSETLTYTHTSQISKLNCLNHVLAINPNTTDYINPQCGQYLPPLEGCSNSYSKNLHPILHFTQDQSTLGLKENQINGDIQSKDSDKLKIEHSIDMSIPYNLYNQNLLTLGFTVHTKYVDSNSSSLENLGTEQSSNTINTYHPEKRNSFRFECNNRQNHFDSTSQIKESIFWDASITHQTSDKTKNSISALNLARLKDLIIKICEKIHIRFTVYIILFLVVHAVLWIVNTNLIMMKCLFISLTVCVSFNCFLIIFYLVAIENTGPEFIFICIEFLFLSIFISGNLVYSYVTRQYLFN